MAEQIPTCIQLFIIVMFICWRTKSTNASDQLFFGERSKYRMHGTIQDHTIPY